MSVLPKSLPEELKPPQGGLRVICLCADWCTTCREFRVGFDGLAHQFPEARFVWMDIEDQADELGDLDVENFPTVLIMRGKIILFFGVMLPYPGHLARMIENFLNVTGEAAVAYVKSAPERLAWQANLDLRRLGGQDV